MPRCGNCGKANREGALFCQDCGHRLGDGRQEARPRPPDGPSCPSCGTVNPAGMSFCKMCGTALPQGGAGKPVSAVQPAGRVGCPQCGKQTPSGYAFCQHCGHRLAGTGSPSGAAAQIEAAPAPQKLLPTPPAGMKVVPAPAPAPAPRQAMPAFQHQPPPAGASPVAAPLSQALLGRLVVLRRDGSDGDVITLSGEAFDIGRSEGGMAFAEDPFLAGRHARFLAYGGVVRVRPLDLVNGVFLRLRDPHELQGGDTFYIGKELLRFEVLSPEERDPPSLVEHGVRLFGSAPRESWARLRQITCAGTTRDLWYLSRSEIVLGREEGDITFPDDEFMSRRHAVLSRSGGRARLIDQNSSNGTYLRLRGDRELRPSDVLRMGDQLVRFEP